MKKILTILSSIGFVVILFTPLTTIGQSQSTQGSTYSVKEEPRCSSGYAHRCTGSGTSCNLTLGWDCAQTIR